MIAFAGFQRGIDHAFALFGRAHGVTQQQSVAVGYLAAIGPHLEMPQPQLLVDDVDQCRDLGPLVARGLYFKLY